MNASTDDELRAWAKGTYPIEAATELLIRTGHAARYTRRNEESGRAWLDFDAAAADVWPGGALSGGERRLVAIAVSLAGVVPHTDVRAASWWQAFNLAETLPGLDRPTLALVLAAIAHAGGSHEQHPDPVLVAQDGTARLNPDRAVTLEPLYPWPQEAR